MIIDSDSILQAPGCCKILKCPYNQFLPTVGAIALRCCWITHFLLSISMFFKYLIISSKTDHAWTAITLFLERVDIAHLISQWYISKFKSFKILTRKRGTPYNYCWDWTQSVSSIIKHDKYTNDSLWFSKRFSFNYVNVTLSLLRNSDIWSSSMLCVLEQAFFVGRGSVDDVVTWLDDILGQIEDGSFGQDFPF